MRIAPRTLMCGTAARVHADISGARFEELRQLCAEAGDKASLAIGMTGLVGEPRPRARARNVAAGRPKSRRWSSRSAIRADGGAVHLADLHQVGFGEVAEVLRLSQTVIDLAEGDPTKGGFGFGSPLATALALRGAARWALGLRGWRNDFDGAVAMALKADRL